MEWRRSIAKYIWEMLDECYWVLLKDVSEHFLCFMNPQDKAEAFPEFWAILCVRRPAQVLMFHKSILRN